MNEVKIGVPIIGGKEWIGGVAYIELLVKAISTISKSKNRKIKIYLIVTDQTIHSYSLHKHFVSLFSGVIFIGKVTKEVENKIKDFLYCKNIDELFNVIDFYFPSFVPLSNKCFAAWIPDFQHKYLPNLFPKEMIVARDKMFSDIAKFSKVVVLSSKEVEKDFMKFYPNSTAITRVLHFHAIPNEEWYTMKPQEVQKKYNLPNNFIICCNQFWKHKNYELLFKAIAKLKKAGQSINLVCTGAKTDYRFQNYFSHLEGLIKKNNIKDLVYILGHIPRSDQIQLIRRSQFLVQPSLFEGWSTVVEDARALGKTILISDLNVNYEQSPKHGVYFRRNDLDDLISKIASLAKVCQPGPSTEREKTAKIESLKLIENYAETFLNIANDSIKIYNSNKEHPLVSIITPSYNHSQFIQETIESVLQQDYPSIEHIVVDGGSTDGTLQILNEWSKRDSRFRFISEPDRGQSHAINKGLKMANGEIIGWLNSDDTYLPGAVRKVVETFKKNPKWGMVYGNAYITNEENKIIRPYSTEKVDLKTLFHKCPISQPAVFIQKYVFKEINGVDETLQFCMDYDLWIRIAKGEQQMGYIQDFLANSRWHQNSKTGSQLVNIGFPEIIKTSQKHFGTVSNTWINHFLQYYWKQGVFWYLNLFKQFDIFGNTPKIKNSNRYTDLWAPPHFYINIHINPQIPLKRFLLKANNKSFNQLHCEVSLNGKLIEKYTIKHGNFLLEIPIDSNQTDNKIEIISKEAMVPASLGNSPDTRSLSFLVEELIPLSNQEYQFYQEFQRGPENAVNWINKNL